MSKTTLLIDEIHVHLHRLQVLSHEIREEYRELAATLLSAHALVPENRWEAWIVANLNLDLQTVGNVMEGNVPALAMNSPMISLGMNEPAETHEKPKINGNRIQKHRLRK